MPRGTLLQLLQLLGSWAVALIRTWEVKGVTKEPLQVECPGLTGTASTQEPRAEAWSGPGTPVREGPLYLLKLYFPPQSNFPFFLGGDLIGEHSLSIFSLIMMPFQPF